MESKEFIGAGDSFRELDNQPVSEGESLRTVRNSGRELFVIPVAYLFAIMTVLGLLMGWQGYQLAVGWHRPNPSFADQAANQLIDYYCWSFIALLIWQIMRVFSLQGKKWKRDLVAHVVISVAMAPLATLLYISGVALTHVGAKYMSVMDRLRLNLRGEIIANAIEYLTILAIIVSVDYYRRYQDEQQEKLRLQHALNESKLLAAAKSAVQSAQRLQLQHALTEAKLQGLRAQLNPHFLFNAMNSVSCLLHRDAAAADTMLSRIANLLRLTLAQDNSREVRLLEEIELVEEYLEIQRIRFGPRLKLEIDVADEALEAHVPNMLLQPLVENACVHGVAQRRGECRLAIQARAEGTRLLLTIYNDGPPVRRDWQSQSGIGLRNTVERLSLLYGEDAKLELSNVQEGVLLSVQIPLQIHPPQRPDETPLSRSTPIQPSVI